MPAPIRLVGPSPYSPFRAAHPPRAVERRRVDPALTATITGSERWIAVASVLLLGGLGALVGYALGRLNLLLPIFQWLDGRAS